MHACDPEQHTVRAVASDGDDETSTSEAAGSTPGDGAPAAAPSAPARACTTCDEDECTCVICFDGDPEYVFMPCGHGGYCQACAHKLFVRPPHHCPICRHELKGVVRVPLATRVGESAVVRPV